MEGDIASHLVDGADKFLLGQLEESIQRRAAFWKRDVSSPEAYAASVEPNRKALAKMLGVAFERIAFEAPELIATTTQSAKIGEGSAYEAFEVRWPVVGEIHGEGILLVPKGKEAVANIVALPDADQTPEQLCGLTPGIAAPSQFARRLAESGCRVLVPALISRTMEKRMGRANLTHREFVYRTSFEMGRHIIGYEVQKILAGVDWFQRESPDKKLGVVGYGEGGMLALYAAALDQRIDAVTVSGYFDSRQNLWQEPIDRNVFGLLKQFGDAELLSLVAPRAILIEAAKAPELTLPSDGGAPARLITPHPIAVQKELDRGLKLVEGLKSDTTPFLVLTPTTEGDVKVGAGPFGAANTLKALLSALAPEATLAANGNPPEFYRKNFDPAVRERRMIAEMEEHNQDLLRDSADVRREFMKKLDTSSLEAYSKSVEWYRDYFRTEVIGEHPVERLPPNVRTRHWKETDKWTAYEVTLDVFPDVFAYGILLWPKDLRDGEKRPVVVCQHGLEGRPQDIITGDHPAYHDFAAKLCERGFITFSPQNLYIFKDRFRTLQRKGNPLGTTLFSIIVPQHQQIVDWLKTLPQVDEKRIGFYGLSYGGKSAMRIPPLVTDYALSICSADFNEWVWKNMTTHASHSYVWTGEYEIFEWNLGHTFNYAEMAALIAPRPFMVERGHFDGVAPDETVAYEFAKVRHFYNARLKLQGKTEIEWFVGPHTINGQGTFDFLHKHLDWPIPASGEDAK
jgi:dienelactone hydrolase